MGLEASSVRSWRLGLGARVEAAQGGLSTFPRHGGFQKPSRGLVSLSTGSLEQKLKIPQDMPLTPLASLVRPSLCFRGTIKGVSLHWGF